MAKGFKRGAGGGNPLNFKVVGNPQPSTAKENTIWIDTDRINNTHFSATQPENMADYDVWITTGTSSTVAFNATKKNPIMVYPLYAKQYVSGALVDKTAKIWQNGQWNGWAAILYDSGNEFADFTGGWVALAKNWFSGATEQPGTPSLTKSASQMNISQSGDGCGIVIANNNIDLTGYTKLKASVYGTSSGVPNNQFLTLSVYKTSITYAHTDRVAHTYIPPTGNSTISIDISSLNGKHKVGFTVVRPNVHNVCSFTVYKVWLER